MTLFGKFDVGLRGLEGVLTYKGWLKSGLMEGAVPTDEATVNPPVVANFLHWLLVVGLLIGMPNFFMMVVFLRHQWFFSLAFL